MAGRSAQGEDVIDERAPDDAPTDVDGAGPAEPTGPAGSWWRFPVSRYLCVLAVLMVTVWISANWLAGNVSYPGAKPMVFMGDFLVEGWMRWDGGWYAGISDRGYSYAPGAMSSVAFFPSYPLAMRIVQLVVPDPAHALPGILVTIACGLAASVMVFRWCWRVLPTSGFAVPRHPAIARTALLILLVYPYGWYLYGAVYADALFLLAAVGAFVLLDKDRPVLAGLVAIVATAGRPVGPGVIIGLTAVLLERRQVVEIPFLDSVRDLGWRGALALAREPLADGRRAVVRNLARLRIAPSRLRPRDGGVLLAAGGLVGWMWYLGATFGDPLLFVHVQSAPGWVQPQGPHTWFKVIWLANVRHLPEYLANPHQHWDLMLLTLGWTFQALLVLGALCLVPLVIRRLGWGYALYVLGVVAIPLLGSKDWQGTGRYLLAAFPVYFVAGGWLAARPRLRVAVLGVSGALLVFLASAFARGFYLA
jgi:hypothetical protein